MFSEGETLEVKTYRDSTDAIRALFVLENENPGKDIVLVRADSSDDVRVAFKNYFSDATEFIGLIEKACEKLGGYEFLPRSTLMKAIIAMQSPERSIHEEGEDR